MDTIDSTVNGIIKDSLTEIADEFELDFLVDSVTEFILNEAIKEFQIENINYYAELIDKDEADTYETRDKQLAKELLDMYGENGKYVNKNTFKNVEKGHSRGDNSTNSKNKNDDSKTGDSKNVQHYNSPIQRHPFDEPSPYNFRDVFETRKRYEKQKLRDFEKLCFSQKVKENIYEEANGRWKSYEDEKLEHQYYQASQDFEDSSLDAGSEAGSEPSSETNSEANLQTSSNANSDEINSGELNSAKANPTANQIIPDKGSFFKIYTQTIKRTFLQAKERIVNHLNEPFGKGITHKATGRPLDEVLREKNFPSPGAPLVDIEVTPIMRVRKEVNNSQKNEETDTEIIPENNLETNSPKTCDNVNGTGDHNTNAAVIDPYERELTHGERAKLRDKRHARIVEANLPDGPWWNVTNVEYLIIGFLVFCLLVQYGTILLWGHPSTWEAKTKSDL